MPGCSASRMFTVCHSRCPVWSDVADLLTGGPSRLALAQPPVPKVAGAAITGLDTTDPRYPDPPPGIASSFGPLAGPGVVHQPRLVPAHGPGPALIHLAR